MHLDSLTGIAERNAKRRAVQNIAPPVYFAGEQRGFGIHDFDRNRFHTANINAAMDAGWNHDNRGPGVRIRYHSSRWTDIIWLT